MKKYTKTNLRKLVASLAGMSLMLAVMAFPVGNAFADTSELSLVLTAGALTITAPADLALATKVVTTDAQTTTGTFADLNVVDARGTLVGWTVVMTSENLTAEIVKKSVGANDTVTLSAGSEYDGTMGELAANGAPCVYNVIIDATDGAVDTALYNVTLSTGCTDPGALQTDETVTATDNPVGTTGVLIDFGAADYVFLDQFDVTVSTFDYSKITVTPADPTATIGVIDGLTKGDAEALGGAGDPSDEKTILTAAPGNGNGDFLQDVALSVALHGFGIVATYDATVTFTVA